MDFEDDFIFDELSPEADKLDTALQSIGFMTYEDFKGRLERYAKESNVRLEDGWELFVTRMIDERKYVFFNALQNGGFQGILLCLLGAASVQNKHRTFLEGINKRFEDIRKILMTGGMSERACQFLETKLSMDFGLNAMFPNEEILDPLTTITCQEVTSLLEKNDEAVVVEQLIESVKSVAIKIVAESN